MLNSVMSFVERQWVLVIIILHIFKIWSSGHMHIENTEFVTQICKLKLEFYLFIVCVTLAKINSSNLLFSQGAKVIFFSMTAQGIRNMIEKILYNILLLMNILSHFLGTHLHYSSSWQTSSGNFVHRIFPLPLESFLSNRFSSLYVRFISGLNDLS